MIEQQPFSASAIRCPVCDSADVNRCISIADVPIYCNVSYESQQQGLEAPRGDIDLQFCNRCSHLFNAAFEPDIVDYAVEYENALHHSARFLDYAESLSAELVKLYDLREKYIVEIGCGPGHFLSLLCSKGNNQGIGFDPSYKSEGSSDYSSAKISILQEQFGTRPMQRPADFLCCRHALEHFHKPITLLMEINQKMGMNTPVYFEVPNAGFTLLDLGIWDLIYEHCGYFTEQSLRFAFEHSGFTVSELTEDFGNQFLGMHARVGDNNGVQSIRAFALESVPALESAMLNFANQYRLKVDYWKNALDSLHASGKVAAVWGAGSKGVSFCNIMREKDSIQYLIDINLEKQGRYIAGSGHRICAPEFLLQQSVDAIIVLNPMYTPEIRRQLDRLGVEAEIIEDSSQANEQNHYA
ncbi:MAG: class I SAM-dependent methyltransferase [Pseudomonadota bacterium]